MHIFKIIITQTDRQMNGPVNQFSDFANRDIPFRPIPSDPPLMKAATCVKLVRGNWIGLRVVKHHFSIGSGT